MTTFSLTADEILATFAVGFLVGMVAMSFIRDAWERMDRE